MSKLNDIIIAGGGPAGLTAAIYAARSGKETVVLEKGQPGGQLWLSESIENYPGFPDGVNSFKLSGEMEKQAKKFGAVIESGEIKSFREEDGIYVAKTGKKEYKAISVIFAMGASMRQLKVKGENRLTGRGVSYCAVCDGPLYRDKNVIVVGGGNTACEEAVFLSRFAEKVIQIHRRPKLRAVGKVAREVSENPKIELLLGEEIQEIVGDEKVEGVKLKSSGKIDIDGVFIFVGLTPNTSSVENFVDTSKGFIKTDSRYQTSLKGVFAAGDCREGSFRQVITACGDGASAAENARKYVEKKKGTAYDW
ncbi:MAG: thioredoxin-disulfide reductase [Elusimicrobiota bacterium]|nr:thioredoxin-disulfide reductase [Elusimicrobiota bacterium]